MLDGADPPEPLPRLSNGPKEWVLKALREAGNSLLSEFYGLDEQTLSRPAGDDGLSLKETAAHLRDAEELALAQMRAIVEGPPGPLPAWDIDVLPLEHDYQAAHLPALLAELRRLRRQTAHLLWGLTDADWQRVGEHPFRGAVTLDQIARELARHDLEHLWRVRRLKEKTAEGSAPPKEAGSGR